MSIQSRARILVKLLGSRQVIYSLCSLSEVNDCSTDTLRAGLLGWRITYWGADKPLRLAKPTASLMIKKLREEGYLEIRERRIFLDKKGEKMIEEALWKHGVLENAFVKLGLSSREACEISWRILDRVPSKIVERIWRNIGMPDRCPCGYPLPTGGREDILNFEVCKTSDSLRRYGSDRSKSD